ncbi:MAG: glycosyltransferase [Blautia sp.]|nr:glycosyltransferase [Blautia sp.]MCM1200189.1 glycosyltransferase [Bacteroides fragilis]
MEKVSVVIPCCNAENYIDRCLKSLENQTYGIENMEIILVDDASTDGTCGRLLRFEEKYPENVLAAVCKENAGPGTARNIGLGYASGEYIAFLDADDVVDASFLERMCEAMRRHDVDIVECAYRTFQDGGQLSVERKEDDYPVRIRTPEDRGRFILNSFKTAVWGRLYKKSFLKENALSFPENIDYGEDNFFSGLAMLVCNSCYHIGDTLYFYYQNAEGLIRKKSDHGRIRQLADVMERYLGELDARGFLDGAMAGYYVEFEWYMIYKYFMDPVSFVISRQMSDWKEQIGHFREKLLGFFPEACHNPYLTRNKRWSDYVMLLKNDNME